MSEQAVAQIGFGQVRHTRLKPRRHQFIYDTFFLMLPMRELASKDSSCALAFNRFGLISFYDQDHGDARSASQGGALGWITELLQNQGIEDATGEIWLHTYPRVFGYAFKPVSFWYCHRLDGSLRAVVVEVNNTFGERHCYLLDTPRYGCEITASKCFHVSPFCTVSGQYRFRFMRSQRNGVSRTIVCINHDDALGPLLNTSISGTLQPLSDRSLKHALWAYPAMTAMVIFRIHLQAFKLWCKRLNFYRKPLPPEHFVTR